ncbi:hypothetical protein [Chitinophaga sp.]|uniref:hypothetical protein n=1 Tax=Chitinophaga sp. TaxID=1869181 RepID=UPI002B682AF2|nr:hypothetical protein [Chitinophaga sp.]HWV64755.1 hypothetical protein [Chitinophaga sp.]
MTKNDWVTKENLLPFLLILSHASSYSFCESDREAIEYGLMGTSDEDNIWFEYKLTGEKVISLRLAKDPEDDLVFYKLEYPDDMEENIELAGYIVSSFYLQPRVHGIWKA